MRVREIEDFGLIVSLRETGQGGSIPPCLHEVVKRSAKAFGEIEDFGLIVSLRETGQGGSIPPCLHEVVKRSAKALGEIEDFACETGTACMRGRVRDAAVV